MKSNWSHKKDERKKLVAEIQKSIDEIRLLLLEVKSKPGIDQVTKADINDAVNTLRKIDKQLPDIAEFRCVLDAIFGLIGKLYDVWRRMFGS
jgi:uncharacterized protein YjgD (DUF1641 family)